MPSFLPSCKVKSGNLCGAISRYKRARLLNGESCNTESGLASIQLGLPAPTCCSTAKDGGRDNRGKTHSGERDGSGEGGGISDDLSDSLKRC